MRPTERFGRTPAIPDVKRKKDEERRGGAAPVAFLSGTDGATLGGARVGLATGARWGFACPRLAAFLGSASGVDVSPGAAAMLAMAAVTLVMLAGPLVLDRPRSDPWGGPGGSAPRVGVEGFAFGVSEGTPVMGARPTPSDLIVPDEAAEAAREKKDGPAAPLAPRAAPPPAPAPPPVALPAPVPTPPAAPARLAAVSFGAGSGFALGGGLRDSLAPFSGVRSLSDTAPPFRSLPAASPVTARRERAWQAGSGALRDTRHLKAIASRAMGQLKFAHEESLGALGAVGDRSRQYATDAFEQGRTLGGTIPDIGLTDGAVAPIGTGAPDVTRPPVGPAKNQTPYQKQMDNAQNGVNQAMLLTLLGLGLLAAGGAMLVAGKAMMSSPVPATSAMGAKLMALGAVLLLAGAAALAAGMMMRQQAKKDANSVSQGSGQKAQGRVVSQCADQAVAPRSCNPTPVVQPGNTVHQDVSAESSAGYDLQGGGHPMNNG